MKIFLTFYIFLIYSSSLCQPKIIRECQDFGGGITYFLLEPNNYFIQSNSHQMKSNLKYSGKWQITNGILSLDSEEFKREFNSYSIEGVTIYVPDTLNFNYDDITKSIKEQLNDHELNEILNQQDSTYFELLKFRILYYDIFPDNFCGKNIFVQQPYELWNQEKWKLRTIKKLKKRNSKIIIREKK